MALGAMALILVLAGAVRADDAYMPPTRRADGLAVRVHLGWCYKTWNPNGGELAGYAITVYDEAGGVLAQGETDSMGDVTLQAPAMDRLRVTLEAASLVNEQSVTVLRGESDLGVAFWSQTHWFAGCAAPATNWEQVR